LKEHPYFKGFDWDALVGRQLRTPWIPSLKRLKEQWDMFDGEKVADELAQVPPICKVEPGMEWAVDF